MPENGFSDFFNRMRMQQAQQPAMGQGGNPFGQLQKPAISQPPPPPQGGPSQGAGVLSPGAQVYQNRPYQVPQGGPMGQEMPRPQVYQTRPYRIPQGGPMGQHTPPGQSQDQEMQAYQRWQQQGGGPSHGGGQVYVPQGGPMGSQSSPFVGRDYPQIPQGGPMGQQMPSPQGLPPGRLGMFGGPMGQQGMNTGQMLPPWLLAALSRANTGAGGPQYQYGGGGPRGFHSGTPDDPIPR